MFINPGIVEGDVKYEQLMENGYLKLLEKLTAPVKFIQDVKC
jgi:hypothetical protein